MELAKLMKNLRKITRFKVLPAILLGILVIFDLPQTALSQDIPNISQKEVLGPVMETAIKSYNPGPSLPEIGQRQPRQTMKIVVTAYNSEPGQTDDTPFITAFNTHVRDGIVATNFLPKGTMVRFPDVYGDKIFVVEDRMNKRYYYRMDIWMADKQEAIKFGAKYLKVEIL